MTATAWAIESPPPRPPRRLSVRKSQLEVEAPRLRVTATTVLSCRLAATYLAWACCHPHVGSSRAHEPTGGCGCGGLPGAHMFARTAAARLPTGGDRRRGSPRRQWLYIQCWFLEVRPAVCVLAPPRHPALPASLIPSGLALRSVLSPADPWLDSAFTPSPSHSAESRLGAGLQHTRRTAPHQFGVGRFRHLVLCRTCTDRLTWAHFSPSFGSCFLVLPGGQSGLPPQLAVGISALILSLVSALKSQASQSDPQGLLMKRAHGRIRERTSSLLTQSTDPLPSRQAGGIKAAELRHGLTFRPSLSAALWSFDSGVRVKSR